MFTLQSGGKDSEFEGSICFNRDGSTTQALLLMTFTSSWMCKMTNPLRLVFIGNSEKSLFFQGGKTSGSRIHPTSPFVKNRLQGTDCGSLQGASKREL